MSRSKQPQPYFTLTEINNSHKIQLELFIEQGELDEFFLGESLGQGDKMSRGIENINKALAFLEKTVHPEDIALVPALASKLLEGERLDIIYES